MLKNLKLKQLSDSVKNKNLIPIENLGQRLKDIREAIGMTQDQMAKRLKVRQPVISRIEENIQASSLKTVMKIARILNCEFRGAIISNEPLEKMIERQAEKVAKKFLERTNANMAMEKQAPKGIFNTFQLNKIKNELISTPDSKLWEE